MRQVRVTVRFERKKYYAHPSAMYHDNFAGDVGRKRVKNLARGSEKKNFGKPIEKTRMR
ncbi:AcrB/AcrD/AcrF family protein [Sesbania bispinosa]|nr:AcrB/AcrD/AcrF family protein [Sesbania bispinosa]